MATVPAGEYYVKVTLTEDMPVDGDGDVEITDRIPVTVYHEVDLFVRAELLIPIPQVPLKTLTDVEKFLEGP